MRSKSTSKKAALWRGYKLLVICFTALVTSAIAGLQPMGDDEMSEVSGRALMQVEKYNNPNSGPGTDNNFFRVTLNSLVSTSVNVGKLLLKDGAGNAQIDIDNLSLNGGDAAGVSSMTLTNPFVEFAFSGTIASDNAQNREIVGIRVGAENMNGFMSFGNQAAVPASQNNTSICQSGPATSVCDGSGGIKAEQGLNLFRGYMKTADIKGTASTLASDGTTNTDFDSISKTRGNYTVTARVNAYNDCSGFSCANPAHAIVAGIVTNNDLDLVASLRFAALTTPVFTVPGIEINTATPLSEMPIVAKGIGIPALRFEAKGDGVLNNVGGFIDLPVKAQSEGVLKTSVPASPGVAKSGLFIDSTIQQELRYIHKVQVSGAGGFYMSAQNTPINWRGSPANDVAQTGWWMSIANEVQLGQVALTDIELPDTTLQSINDRISVELVKNPISAGTTAILDGLVGGGYTVIPIGEIDLPASTPTVALDFPTSQNLGSAQTEVRNCWNGSLGC